MINALILAGGFSKRMGQDKALINYHGVPQVEYLSKLCKDCGLNPFISIRADQSEQLIFKNFEQVIDSKDFTDKPGGPLAAILSAMKMYPNQSWLILACDLPYIDKQALEFLIAHRNENKMATAFISTYDSLPEPLCAIWEAKSFAGIIELVNKGIKCPRKVLLNLAIEQITQSNPKWLDNINTPEELSDITKNL